MGKNMYEDVSLNNVRKRFNQINEYILNMNKSGTNEEGDADMQNNQQPSQDAGAMQQTPPQQNAQQQQMPQQPQQMDNQQMGAQNMQQPGAMNQGQDMGMQGDMDVDPTVGADDMSGMSPEGADNGIIEPQYGDYPDMMGGEDDEVIDVDDLTQSQETTEYKLEGVDDKLNQLINIVSKFAQAIDDNEDKMEELKRELEERNPTQQERLNLRSMSGSPYTVSPQDYWSSQNARNPQYNVIADNDVAPNDEQELYTITDDDIDKFDKREIEKSINDIPKNLKDYFA